MKAFPPMLGYAFMSPKNRLSLNQAGWEARKTPAAGCVFPLDTPLSGVRKPPSSMFL
jgi:hypothetical protein